MEDIQRPLQRPVVVRLLAVAAHGLQAPLQTGAIIGRDVLQAVPRLQRRVPTRPTAVRAALASLDDMQRTAERILAAFGPDIASRREVVWMDRPQVPDPRRPATLRVAPLEVGGLLAERLFRRRRVVLTSATLALGGSFQPLARQ